MKIVSLLPSATEILFAIGAGSEVVAVTHECDYPHEARGIPAITSSAVQHDGSTCAEIDRHVKQALHSGSSIYKLNEGLLAELEPDLIITQELCEVCAVSYRDVGQAVRAIDSAASVVSLEPTSIDDILTTIITVGELSHHEAVAMMLVRHLRKRLAEIRRRNQVKPRPRLACIEWTDPLMVAGHWVPEMVDLAGGIDALGRVGEPSQWIHADAIQQAAPDTVVLMPCGFDLRKTEAIGRELILDGPAWLHSANVVAVDGSAYFNRPGPRIIDGVKILAAVLREEASDGSGFTWLRRQRT